MALFKIRDIQPNPFRHMERYPIQKDKVAAIRESLRATGYWENVVARMNGDGPQIAYGHHRLQALKEHFGPEVEVELIIQDLDDEQMLKIMARENMEEWGHSAAVEHETVRATIEAYAAGRIHLRKPTDKNSGQVRYAPNFLPGPALGEDASSPKKPYNEQTLAEFLGWLDPAGRRQQKIEEALAALAHIEEGILRENDFDGLNRSQARAVVEQADLAKGATEAHAIAADERRARAEADLKDARKRAAKAKEDQEREEAEMAAKDAERRVYVETKRASDLRATGKKRATKTGQHVADQLRGSKRGTKDVADIAREVQDWPVEEKIPPKIDKFAAALAVRIGKVFNGVEPKLEELIKWKEHIPQENVGNLLAALDEIIAKAQDYRASLGEVDQGDFIDGEVIDEDFELQAVGS